MEHLVEHHDSQYGTSHYQSRSQDYGQQHRQRALQQQVRNNIPYEKKSTLTGSTTAPVFHPSIGASQPWSKIAGTSSERVVPSNLPARGVQNLILAEHRLLRTCDREHHEI